MSNGGKKPFNSLLFNYKTENTSELTHTRIGSSELNIYSGKYKIGKTDEKDFYKRDPKEFDFKEILSLSNDEEKKALEKFSGINFKSLDMLLL